MQNIHRKSMKKGGQFPVEVTEAYGQTTVIWLLLFFLKYALFSPSGWKHWTKYSWGNLKMIPIGLQQISQIKEGEEISWSPPHSTWPNILGQIHLVWKGIKVINRLKNEKSFKK